jgi:hypothetical protein
MESVTPGRRPPRRFLAIVVQVLDQGGNRCHPKSRWWSV